MHQSTSTSREHPMATKPTLVLGGTGKTGRRVVERLAARRIPDSRRFAIRRAAVRLGRPVDVGAGARRRGVRVRLALSGRRPGSGRDGRLVRRPRGEERRTAPRAAVGPRRGRGRAGRAGRARLRRRADDPALDLVRAELQRELLRSRRSSAASWRCPPARCPSRSSTSTTSPTSRSRR